MPCRRACVANSLPARLLQQRPRHQLHGLPWNQHERPRRRHVLLPHRFRVERIRRHPDVHRYVHDRCCMPMPPLSSLVHAHAGRPSRPTFPTLPRWPLIAAVGRCVGARRPACAANSYNGVAGSTCKTCPLGSTSAAGASTCTCGAGYAVTGTAESLVCSPCGAGTFTSGGGACQGSTPHLVRELPRCRVTLLTASPARRPLLRPTHHVQHAARGRTAARSPRPAAPARTRTAPAARAPAPACAAAATAPPARARRSLAPV